MKRKNEAGKSVFLYLHPREIDPQAPKLQLPPLERLIHYYGVEGCERKFTKILQKFNGTFMVMGDHIRQLNIEKETNGQSPMDEDENNIHF